MQLLVSLLATLALGGDAPVDAGLSTQVLGEVHLRVVGGEQPLEPFSKLRVGDVVLVGAGGGVALVYFDTGRRETWKGPAELVIGEGASQAQSGAAPAVDETDVAVGAQLQTLPLLLARAERNRSGQGVVRNGDETLDPRTLLDDEEREALAAAKARYEALRKVFEPRDVLPDIYYATVLRSYGLHAEADQVLVEARRRCEFCDLPPLSSGAG